MTARVEGDLREAFACFPTGVVAMCALAGGKPAGLAVSSFTSVSLDPPLVSVCVQNTSRTWPVLRALPRIGLSVLAHDQDDTCRRLAEPGDNRFAGLGWHALAAGGVLIDQAIAGFDCSMHATVPAGDHCLALLEVHRYWICANREPLVFHASRYRRLDSGAQRQ